MHKVIHKVVYLSTFVASLFTHDIFCKFVVFFRRFVI